MMYICMICMIYDLYDLYDLCDLYDLDRETFPFHVAANGFLCIYFFMPKSGFYCCKGIVRISRLHSAQVHSMEKLVPITFRHV